tara:strand:+ start:529 stop:843 length:315 start_codon:yes stop_codon:yes gene_type:complete
MNKDYLQLALMSFNTNTTDEKTMPTMWYGWKKYNDDGSRIPDAERKNYENIIVIIDGATMPTEAEVNAKIQELKDAEAQKVNDKISAQNKLKALGLTDAEIKAL